MKRTIYKINIDPQKIRFGTYLGFKLSRLEWIWDAEFDFCKNDFILSKKEILSFLPTKSIDIDETDYISFSQSILNFYFRNDQDIYYSILIGYSIQRSALIGVSNEKSKNDELINLAKSALKSIPDRIVNNKEYLFDVIMDNNKKELFEIIELLESFCEDRAPKKSLAKSIFLSYCSNDIEIARFVENKLNEIVGEKIYISKYNDLKYKQSFKKFMDCIQDYDYVICIVTDNYLKSFACMYEVGEIIKDHKFHEKINFIVLQENDRKYYGDNLEKFVPAKIFGNEKNRIYYLKYWENQYEDLKNTINDIKKTEATTHATKKLSEIKRIYEYDMGEILDYLSDRKCESLDQMCSSNFRSIIESMNI